MNDTMPLQSLIKLLISKFSCQNYDVLTVYNLTHVVQLQDFT